MNTRASLISILLSIVFCTSAQVPQKFNYQAVVRNAQHAVITNQEVGFQLSILKGSPGGSPVYVETHAVTTNAVGLADLVIGEGSVSSGTFADILWGENAYYLKVEVDPSGGSSYEHMGTSQMISVPYSLWSGNISSPTRKFTVQEEPGHPVDSALFEVRNAEGQTVFAVYPEGTRVYVLDEEAKGRKGGFAVGGYSRKHKGITQEYMVVSPDSIRLYFDEEATKGRKGGFAVGGYSRKTKGATDNYFELQPDSAKFLMVSDQPLDSNSGALSIKTKSTLGGDLDQGTSLFNLTRENYFIGHRTGESMTEGYNNCFFGFESGTKTTEGIGNIFIGERSGYENLSGVSNIYLGNDAGNNNNGSNNVFIGMASGQHLENSENNTFLGGWSGTDATSGHSNVFVGNSAGRAVASDRNTLIGAFAGAMANNAGNNVFIGSYAGEEATGEQNVIIGQESGHYNTGNDNVFIGGGSGYNCENGSGNVFIGRGAGVNNNGSRNIIIGKDAGWNMPGSEMLLISNSNCDSTAALIWGKFDQGILRFNHRVGIGRNATDYALEVEGEAYKTASTEWATTSDARVKTDIKSIENGLDQIMRLRPVTYKYTDEWMEANPGIKDQVYYHYIAQEFAEVFPESVHRGPEALEGDSVNLLRMNSQPAQVVSIKAIQELAEQNRKQQAIIEELMQKVSAIEKQISGSVD